LARLYLALSLQKDILEYISNISSEKNYWTLKTKVDFQLNLVNRELQELTNWSPREYFEKVG
jgi:hypothetical protein